MDSCLNFCSILTSIEEKLLKKEFPSEKIENIIKVKPYLFKKKLYL